MSGQIQKDLCEIKDILKNNLEKPDTYREVILALGENNILTNKFSKEIANMIC